MICLYSLNMISNKKPFILTFGSTGWDRVVDKDTRALIYEEEGRKNSHQAVAAKFAGAESMLVSFVGDDEIGKKCLQSLNNCGIDTRYIKIVKGAKTEINIQLLNPVTKDYDLERGPAQLSQNYTPEMVKQYSKEILSADFVILVSKQPKDFLSEIINFCDSNGIKTVLTVSHPKFDIKNPNDLQVLKKCTFITGNFQESIDLSGKTIPEEMLKFLPNMIITNGAHGVWFCDESGKACHEPALKMEKVVETNGAGDTFIGNFVVFKTEGKSITESVRIGQSASAIEIGKMGVLNAMPHRADTLKVYNNYFYNK